MRQSSNRILLVVFALLWVVSACGGTGETVSRQPLRVLVVESFLADIAQNVAGDRTQVETLMPRGLDPHTFEPTPQDIARIAECQVLVINGAGLEGWIEETLENAGGQHAVIEAAAGLTSRESHEEDEETESGGHHHEGDPHFWLDPNNVVHYVENIRDGLIQADPEGKDVYTQNAAAYIAQLQALDRWIAEQVAQVPPERRLLVTNHESFGYYADRYGFQVVGAIVPSVSTGASPSAQELAALVDRIRETGAPAVFLEMGVNPKLAEQLAQETGVRVVTGLYTHSPSDPGGPAPTYLEMIRYNTQAIVAALAPTLVPPCPTLPAAPTVPAYPSPSTVPSPLPTLPPTATPLPVSLPALPLSAAAPAADWDMEEVVLLGISQTERVALQVQLRSGETRLAPLSPEVVPAGVLYRTWWISPHLILQPTGQPTDVLSAPLMVLDWEDRMLYRIAVPRGYWVGSFALSPDGQQLAYDQFWVYDWGDYNPTGPAWEVRVWDLPAGQVRVLLSTNSTIECYVPVYWRPETSRLYLQQRILESDVGPQELVVVSPDGSGWQTFADVRGVLSFSPDGLAAAYLVYDEALAAGWTYYNQGLTRDFNQLWVLDLSTGESRILLQADDGAQYGQFGWTADGLLLLRYRAADYASIQEWELLRVDPASGETTSVFRQEGSWPAPPGGPFSPQEDRWLFWNWMDQQYTMLDLAAGQLQDVTGLVSGLDNFIWCEDGTTLIEQWGGQVTRIDLQVMTVEALTGWTEVARCR